MKNTARLLIVTGALLAAAAVLLWMRRGEAPAPRAFVANYGDDTVSVIDLGIDREIKVLDVGDSPYGITVCGRVAPIVAVANSTASTVTLIDPASLEIVGRVPVGKGPEHVACSPDGTRLYVTSPYDLTITVVDPRQRAVIGNPIRTDKKPGPVAVAPDGSRLYVVLRDEQGVVQSLDPATGAVQASAPVGRFPTDVAVSADGRRLLAPSFDDSRVTVVDAASFKVLGEYPVMTGTGLLLHPSRPLAYSMAGVENAVAVFDYETGATVASIAVREWPTYSAISLDGRVLYVVNEESDSLVKVDTESNAVLGRVAVGSDPSDVAIVNFPS